MTDYELIKQQMENNSVKCYHYQVQFLGNDSTQVLVGPSYRVTGYYKYADAKPRIFTVWTFDPRKKHLKRSYEVLGPIKIINKSEVI